MKERLQPDALAGLPAGSARAPAGVTPLRGDLHSLVAWLDSHTNFESGMPARASAPTLDRSIELCRLLGDPQRAYPTLHVTGTNGKGSTVRMLSNLIAATGLSVGTYTSPNLSLVNERICRGEEPISDEELGDVLYSLAQIETLLADRPTRFELLSAAGFAWFADVAVDVAVIEVGLGGRWDATNVISPEVAVVTNISYDHVEVLGPTLKDIAVEKSGILKSGCRPVIGETSPELLRIFEDEATRSGSLEPWVRDRDFGCEADQVAVGGRLVDLRTPGARYEDLFISLHGAHQVGNAACALAAAEAFFGSPLDDGLVREVLGSVRVPGRLELAGSDPVVLLDGAHNAAGMEVLGRALSEELRATGPTVAVVGMLTGRDPSAMLRPLASAGVGALVACTAPCERALPAAVVSEAAGACGIESVVVEQVGAALARAREMAGSDGMVVVTGSLYVVGAARSLCATR
ncbi:MAG: bifunctional folylpolyglutamate synthase/dihydrofolate synthase [Actinomycetota bacterium]|nr:bifunctional folylpolyglutamate synthase/dihydrofolate synthase [Actinomycetota bacterium]